MTNSIKLIASAALSAALIAATSTAALAGNPGGILNTEVQGAQGEEVAGAAFGGTTPGWGWVLVGGVLVFAALGGGKDGSTTTSSTAAPSATN
jgi:hypothetical protein